MYNIYLYVLHRKMCIYVLTKLVKKTKSVLLNNINNIQIEHNCEVRGKLSLLIDNMSMSTWKFKIIYRHVKVLGKLAEHKIAQISIIY